MDSHPKMAGLTLLCTTEAVNNVVTGVVSVVGPGRLSALVVVALVGALIWESGDEPAWWPHVPALCLGSMLG